eukprot:TRINITY_DN5260_c0_g5_i1.p1 TRINITY_DN5260_c0_g5~~TRINITY_DN5260_c0_g5_i1.p1  ORF type:complete len:351 (+),score=77.05 TRINITY_DN5260_c0_g5_i1:3-1055(+)
MCIRDMSLSFFFFFKQKTAYEIMPSLVGSEMCIRDSYYAVNTKNGLPRREACPAAYSDDPRCKENCKTCNFWKPPRTHHCSVCGECVARMDHHCPWINNCVGQRNHKSFLLFCLYFGVGMLHYIWRGGVFLFHVLDTNTFWNYSIAFYVIWAGLTLMCLPTCLMLLSLGGFHVNLAFNNLTTLDSMQSQMRLVCLPQNRGKKHGNVYYLGVWRSFMNFYGSWFFWWWPTPVENDYDGLYHDTTPPVLYHEVQPVVSNWNKDFIKNESERKKVYQDINARALEMYSNKHIQLNGQMFEVGKHHQGSTHDHSSFFSLHRLKPSPFHISIRTVTVVNSVTFSARWHSKAFHVQ